MESPEGDRIKAASTSTPASSPAVQVQDSPFTDFATNLSPIKSDKASRYAQGFSQTNFQTPPPVFRTPRLDLQRETSFLKSKEIDAAGVDVYGDCGSRVNTIFIPCSRKELQSSSPSGCIDEYLTEPWEVEVCKNSAGLCLRPANDMCKLSQCGLTGPMVTRTKVDDSSDRNSEDIMLMLSDQAEIDPLRSVNSFEAAIGSQELSPKERTQQAVSNTFLLSSVHQEQYVSQSVKLQKAGIEQNGRDGSSQSPTSLLNVEAYKDGSEGLEPMSKRSFNESTSYLHGIRRHLQFEAAMAYKNSTTCKGHDCHDVTQETDNSTFPVRLTDLESLIPYDIESSEVSSSREATCNSQNTASRLSFCQSEFISSNQYGGKVIISDRIPSGIGFHLNSTVGSVSMGSDLIPSKELPGCMSSQEDILIPEGLSHVAQDSNNCLISTVAEKLHAHFDNDPQDDQGVVGTSSATTQYTDRMKLLCDSLKITLSEQQEAACEGMMLASQNSDRGEELNKVSPKKKRKKATCTSEDESCKRCNCRRSKCLKLYCECFAAGVYCIDSCACENCFNKPEYEETVLDMRQQIESRNPLAFAPKIVSHATDSPANVAEDGNWTTPASARHKRGCNCKKSKCLKKYCECFQANVGCSDGCRCEGCNNSFGKKTVTKKLTHPLCGVTESKFGRVERWENQSHVKLDDAETVTDQSKSGAIKQFLPRWEDLPDISHLTPPFHPYSGAEDSSSPNTRDCPKVPRPQLHQRNSFKASALHSYWPRSPIKEDDTPEILKDTSTPTKAIKVSSPNQKRVSPPQYRSKELRSSSSRGLRSGRKFILPAVPSFPPLTPYSKSKEDVGQTETDFKGDTNDH